MAQSVSFFHLRPYRNEHSASRPIRADKHCRGQRVLTWVTSREHCAAAGFFFSWLRLEPLHGCYPARTHPARTHPARMLPCTDPTLHTPLQALIREVVRTT